MPQQQAIPSDSTTTASAIYPDFTYLCFADANNGWVASSDYLFHTQDGGQTWSEASIPGERLYTSLACIDAQTTLVAVFGGRIHRTSDSGANWSQVAAMSGQTYTVANSQWHTDIAAGAGDFSVSKDDGRSWTAIAAPSETFRKAAFLSAQHAIVIAARGSIYQMQTLDGPFTPIAVANDSSFFIDIVSTGESSAIAASRQLLLYVDLSHPTNAVRIDSTYYNTQVSGGTTIWSIAFADSLNGWVASAGIHRTKDHGNTWNVQLTAGLLYDVAFRDSIHGLAVGEHGLILSTSDGGHNWRERESGTSRRLLSVAFTGDTAWARAGWSDTTTVLLSTDSGATWQQAKQPNIATSVSDSSLAKRFRALSVIDNHNAFALDNNGQLLATNDSARTWARIDPVESRMPAPWYYLVLVLATFIASLAFREREQPPTDESIADILVSDRPWQPGMGKRNSLPEFPAVALGIAQFLANRRTQPPLTIAIIGEWGTGKSSLMNMLHENLRRRNFRPIWFNAWHHQREESLLAGLFEGIRQQGIPHSWTWRGVVFRAKLFYSRVRNYPAQAAILMALFLFGVGFFIAEPHSLIPTLRSVSDLNWSDRILRAIALLGGAGSAIVAFWKLRPFGNKPADLLNQVRTFGSIQSKQASTDFRYAFARDFKEVADALKPHPMVIFIDDLDRCKPDEVMEVLEAINFLQTCGDVVIVLGMDRARVMTCVGLAYKDVAVEFVNNPEADLNKDGVISSEEGRLDFARQYLEKLINIEIPVPVASAEALGNLASNRASESMADPGDDAELPPYLARAARFAQAALLVLALAGLLGFGIHTGRVHAKHHSMAVATTSATSASRIASQPAQSVDAFTNSGLENTPGALNAATIGPLPLYVALLPVLLLIGVAILGAARSIPETIVDDSQTFQMTLKFWSPLLFARLTTPRSAKKFINRVRFLAMRQRVPNRGESVLQRLRAWAAAKNYARLVRMVEAVGARAVVAHTASDAIPEAQLVTLCVFHETMPAWLNDDAFWNEDFSSFVTARRDQLPAAVRDMRAFPAWQPLAEYRERFEQLIRSVRVR